VVKGGLGRSASHSKETREKIRKSLKKRWLGLPKSEKERIINEQLTGPKKGRIVSEKTKHKLRLYNLGKKQSQETINKRSKSLKGIKRENKHRFKAVEAFDGNDKIGEFLSIKKASIDTGIGETSICKALKGVQKKAGKLIWKYKKQ